MSEYLIKNNGPLKGHVKIDGAKNSVLALIAATILTKEIVILENVPNVSDVQNLLHAMETMGSKIDFDIGNHKLTIQNDNIDKDIILGYEYIRKIRASYYLLGSMLGMYHHTTVALPGGCNIGVRPIDLHLKGFETLGASVDLYDGNVIVNANDLIGNTIYLDFPSVGATINIMLASVLAKGKTIIQNAAKEPHIIDLANLLTKMGAKIKGVGTSNITIYGVDKLYGATHTTIPDQIEAGTFIIATAITRGDVYVENVEPAHLTCLTLKLQEMGIHCDCGDAYIHVYCDKNMVQKPTCLVTLPYPGFPTDLQPQMAALMSLSNGVSTIDETIFENRYMYVDELARMGAKMTVNGITNIVHNIPYYKGATVYAPDLRAGAALVLAGLVSKGNTTIKNIDYIKRGYENFDEKLRNLGAYIIERD